MIQIVLDNGHEAFVDTKGFVDAIKGDIEYVEASDGSDLFELLEQNPTIVIGDMKFRLDTFVSMAELSCIVNNVTSDNISEFEALNEENYFCFLDADGFYTSLNQIAPRYTREYVDAIISAMSLSCDSSFSSLGILNLINLARDDHTPKDLCEYMRSFNLEEISYLIDLKYPQKASFSPLQKVMNKQRSGFDIA